MSSVAKALRPLHWAKNLLVFVPLVMAHEFTNKEKLTQAMLAFASFSLCASGVYVLNDLFDSKPTGFTRSNGLARLPLENCPVDGLATLPMLLAAGMAIGAGFPGSFLQQWSSTAPHNVVFIYGKREPIVDVLLLTDCTCCASWRRSDNERSRVPWLLAFSMFSF